jgi:hypothetical protein
MYNRLFCTNPNNRQFGARLYGVRLSDAEYKEMNSDSWHEEAKVGQIAPKKKAAPKSSKKSTKKNSKKSDDANSDGESKEEKKTPKKPVKAAAKAKAKGKGKGKAKKKADPMPQVSSGSDASSSDDETPVETDIYGDPLPSPQRAIRQFSNPRTRREVGTSDKAPSTSTNLPDAAASLVYRRRTRSTKGSDVILKRRKGDNGDKINDAGNGNGGSASEEY